MSYSPGRSSSAHPSSSPSSSRRPSSSARSWSLSQSLLQNATAAGNGGGGLQLPAGSTAAAAATPSSSTSTSTTKKSVVLVKLTDAAIRALEEYVRLSNEAAVSNTEIPKPSIRFPTLRDALGGFSIPLAAAAPAGPDDDDGGGVPTARFAFSLSSTEDAASKQGSFECLQADRPGSLQSVGPVQEKLQVQASDDSYTRFRHNVDMAKKDSEKRTTQFLDRGPGSGSKSIARLYPPRPAVHPPRPAPSSSSSSSTTPRMVHGQQKTRHGNNDPSSGAISNRHHPHHSSLPGKHPMLDRKKNNSPNSSSMKQHHYHAPAPTNSEVMRRPLKERIIHLLAVRPYKKPELLARITRDGIREKDRQNITGYLKQVSFMKDNTYHLHRHLWNDVSEDWQFYSEQERQMMKRRKPQNLTPPCSDGSTSSSGHSPSQASRHTPPRRPDPPSVTAAQAASSGQVDKRGLKRPRPSPNSGGGGFQVEEQGGKKVRLSNYVRPPDMQRFSNGYNSSSPRSEPGLSPRPTGGILDKSPRSASGLTRSPNGAPSPLFGQHGGNGSGSPHGSVGGGGGGNAMPATMTAEDARQQQLQPVENVVIQADYELEYREPETKAQRDYLKSVFKQEHQRYLEMHKTVSRVSEGFVRLENQMHTYEHGSLAWKKMKSKIMQEYGRQRDEGFAEFKREYQYLHMKLAHIKALVTKYDEMQVQIRA